MAKDLSVKSNDQENGSSSSELIMPPRRRRREYGREAMAVVRGSAKMTRNSQGSALSIPPALAAAVASRPRYYFDDGAPTALNHIGLGGELNRAGKLYRLSSPSGGLLQIKGGLPKVITKGGELAAVISDGILFDYVNTQGDPAKISKDRLQLVLDSEDFLSQFHLLDGVVSVASYDADFNVQTPGFNDGGDGYRYFHLGPEPEVLKSQKFTRQYLDATSFASRNDASRFLAAALTVMLRPHWPGAKPMPAITANKRQAGKDSVMAAIAGLTQMIPLQWEKQDWALGKNLAALKQNNPLAGLFCLGNVRLDGAASMISSAWLEHVLTDPFPVIYSTGTGTPTPVLNNFMFGITTNEGQLSPDLVSRSLLIHLVAFGNLAKRKSSFGAIKEEHLPKVQATLEAELRGMIEKWKRAGKPLDDKARHRFLPWARTIGGILLVNGFTGFLDNMDVRVCQSDPLRLSLARLGEHKPNTWADAEEWHREVVRLGLRKTLVPAGYQTGKVSQVQGLDKMLHNHQGEELVIETLDGICRYCLGYKVETFGGGAKRRLYCFEVID